MTTHAATDAWIRRALHAVHDFTGEAARHLAGGPGDDLARHVAELDVLLERVRAAVAPLVHPLSPMRHRKARARTVLALLDECARQVRGLAEVVADPYACHDERLTAACHRVEIAVRRLVPPGTAGSGTPAPGTATGEAAGPHPHADRALEHLRSLETALTGLAAPSAPPRVPRGPGSPSEHARQGRAPAARRPIGGAGRACRVRVRPRADRDRSRSPRDRIASNLRRDVSIHLILSPVRRGVPG